GERIEEGLRSGKIQGASNGQDGAKRKKEGEANAIAVGSSQGPTAQLPYFQYPYVAAVAQGQYPQPVYPMPPTQQQSTMPRHNRQQQKSQSNS
ncbi:hypothetical protein A2U01_0078641, partial [Trifolium medium]|nr:hypothetical protein [Trifolium medium]